MSKNKTLATVNGVSISEQDVETMLQRLGSQRAARFESVQGRQRILEDLITQQLLLADAKENSLEQEEAFQEQLSKVKDDVLIQYSVQKLINAVQIDSKEVQEYYEQHKDEFMTGDSVQASHILLDNETVAQEVLGKLNDGMTFEEAANVFSKCQSEQNGGDLGFFTRGKMVQEFEEVAFAMEVGEISQPVKTQFGYHIIKLVARKPARPSVFAEVEDQLGQQLLETKRNETYQQKSQALRGKYTVVVND